MAIDEDDDEQLQDPAFDPGNLVRLVAERGEDGDVEGLRHAGDLLDRAAKTAGAAIECGLAQSALVLNEDRSPADDRRERH